MVGFDQYESPLVRCDGRQELFDGVVAVPRTGFLAAVPTPAQGRAVEPGVAPARIGNPGEEMPDAVGSTAVGRLLRGGAVLGLGLLFGVAVGTAIMPIAGVEALLVGFMLVPGQSVPWWVAGLVAAAGQLCGKVVHLRLATRVAVIPAVHRRLAGTVERCRRCPRTAAGVVLMSSTIGLPPFTALVPAVAASGLDLRPLIPVAVVGRTLRFLVLAGSPALVQWL